MSVVYKYPVNPDNKVQYMDFPSSSKILSAIEQNGQIMIYALVQDPFAPNIWDSKKRLLVLGTGWEFNEVREYEILPFSEIRFIGSVKIGSFVWHVMELVEPEIYDNSPN